MNKLGGEIQISMRKMGEFSTNYVKHRTRRKTLNTMANKIVLLEF